MAASAPTRVACVTGASSGIGRASAIALAQAGWTVVISGRRAEELDETVRLARKENAEAKLLAVSGDLSKAEDVDKLFETIRTEFGRLDMLFNNAGRGAQGVPLEEIPLDTFLSVVNINLVAPFLCTQHAFRIMKDQSPQGGRIINNGSISAHAPRPFSAPYTTTKHAISGLTKSTSLDGRAYNIACSQIDIGNAQSAMVASQQAQGHLQPNGERIQEAVMDVQEVANAVVHMASLPLSANVLNMVRLTPALIRLAFGRSAYSASTPSWRPRCPSLDEVEVRP
ncbi:hypothetical protein JCM11251_003305 [Rhodosporidiobolus azoricus]